MFKVNISKWAYIRGEGLTFGGNFGGVYYGGGGAYQGLTIGARRIRTFVPIFS